MPLTRLPVHVPASTVAATFARERETPLADVLLAHDFAAGVPWTPLYARTDIPPATWAAWSRWLTRRLVCILDEGLGGDVADASSQWLAQTLGELAQHEHPERAPLVKKLRQVLERPVVGATEGATGQQAARVWWRAQIAEHLAAGRLGPVTPEAMTAAAYPWLEAQIPRQVGPAIWILPALTTALTKGTLTAAQAARYLERGGGEALQSSIPHDPAFLAVPAWRAAWWQYLHTAQGISSRAALAEAFRLQCITTPQAWGQWPAADLEAWWGWIIATQLHEGTAHTGLLITLRAIVCQSTDGRWLAAQPAFHRALEPLFTSPDPAARETGLRIVGMTPATPARSPSR